MKKKLGPTDILFPVPAALVASGTVEQPNVLVVAWIGMMGSDPPVLGISLQENRYSLELIRRTGAFSVNIPSADQFRETDYCGLVSGRRRNKIQDCGFRLAAGSAVPAPIILDCPFNLECALVRETAFGSWVALFGEIRETHVDADKIDKKTGRPDIQKINPLVYCATVREYWSLGARLGFGFNAGKEIRKRCDGQRLTGDDTEGR
jgi:flavin reductase (DIM6/NTAB) family NADH-FMN oxidoreductase RutF